MNQAKPSISIVTPSYNMLRYLPLCCASVADQGVQAEHVIMDGASSDGTPEWLRQHPELISTSEKDKGMYHALNKAIERSTGEIIGHLNCDEQYLPGTLKTVQEFFDTHPQVDFVAADFLVINPEGNLIAYRKSFKPIWLFFFSNYLYTTTCTLFYRRKIFEKCRFDESYRSIADVIFLYDVLRKGFRGEHIRSYFATFIYSGDNLSLNPVSAKEKERFNATLPWWYRVMKPFFFLMFFVNKVFHGNYFEKKALTYSIYLGSDITQRASITKVNPTFRLRFG